MTDPQRYRSGDSAPWPPAPSGPEPVPHYGASPSAQQSVPPYGSTGYYGQPAATTPYGNSSYPPTQSGYPVMMQPPPKRRGRVALVIVAAVVVVLAVCIGGVALLGAGATDTNNGAAGAPTTGGRVTPTPSATPETPGALLYSKIVRPPAGSEQWSLDKGVKGVFTAKQIAAQTFTNPKTEAGWLTTAGFVVAAGRHYTRPDGVEILVFVIEFKKAAGATSLYDQVRSGRRVDKTVTGTFGVPGGVGYEWKTPDDVGNRRSEMYKAVGNTVIFLNVYTPGAIAVASDLQLLAAQVNALS